MRLPDLNIKKKSKSTAFAGIRRARGKLSLLTPEDEWVNMLLIQKKTWRSDRMADRGFKERKSC